MRYRTLSLPEESSRAARRGIAVVELAVLLPFLVFIFLVTVDYARILYYTIIIENCVENGSLFGGQVFDDQNQQWIGNQQYWQGPDGQLVSVEKVAAELAGTSLSPAVADSNITIASGTDSDGNAVNIITIQYTFHTITAFPGIPSQVNIVRTAQVRVGPANPS